MREELIQELKKYQPWNEQEEKDVRVIIDALEKEPDIFLRENKNRHMTASAWIVNKDRSKTIMAYHNIYDSFTWLGGHADGQEDLSKVALMEVMEESGIQNPRLVTPNIFSVEILTVNGHIKRGEYVSSHLHLNVTYLIEADESESLQMKEDENSDVQWFSFEEALQISKEPWFVERIYPKLIEKTKKLK